MNRLPIVVIGPRVAEFAGPVQELNQNFAVTRIVTAGARFPIRAQSARCAILLGEKPDWLRAEFSAGGRPPIVWMPLLSGEHHDDAVPGVYCVPPLERERLVPLVASCVIEELLDRIRRALVTSSVLSGREKLRKVLSAYLGTDPPRHSEGGGQKSGSYRGVAPQELGGPSTDGPAFDRIARDDRTRSPVLEGRTSDSHG